MIAARIALFLFPSATATQSIDPCSLLPGSPEKKEPSANQASQLCVGQYWIRQTAGPDGGSTVGMTLVVAVTPSVEEARRLAARPEAWYRSVTYGDGGLEKLEIQAPEIQAPGRGDHVWHELPAR